MKLLAVLMLLGCGGAVRYGPGDAATFEATLALEVGSGYAFTPIPSGSDVAIVRGPQGADMLVLALRVRGLLDPHAPTTAIRIVTERGVAVAAQTFTTDLTRTGPDTYEVAGLFAPFFDEFPASTYENQQVRVEVDLTDRTGHGGSSEKLVRAAR